MLETIGTITGILISIGAIVVSVTTQLNHLAHVKEDVVRIDAETKDLKIKIDGIHESISGLSADVKAMKGICDERHK